MATIRDIAKAARVSKAAVSYVINNKPGVSEETRLKILAVMREMNFTPNVAARGLAGQTTGMFGLVIPDISDMFYANIIRGVENKANEFGYTLNLCTTHAIADKERAVVDLFTSGRVDGVILMTYFLDHGYLQELKKRRVPFVTIDNPNVDESIYSITVDNEEAGYKATKYLLELGHRRIAFIHGPEGADDSIRRYDGYVKALKEYGIKPELAGKGDFTRAGGYAAGLELLDLDQPPTAVFAANDQMALGVLRAANERGISVPQSLSIVGVDDIEEASLTVPSLTTIKQPIYEMGNIAAGMIIELIKGGKPAPRHITLQTELVVRESCRTFV